MRALRACSVGFALLALSRAAVAQMPSGGLTPNPWHGEGDYFARFVVFNAGPFVDKVNAFLLLGLDTVNETAALQRPDHAERPDDVERPDDAERPADAERSDDAERPDNAERPDDAERPGNAERPDDAERSNDAERSEVLEPHVTPEPSTWLLLGTGLVGVFGILVIRSTRA